MFLQKGNIYCLKNELVYLDFSRVCMELQILRFKSVRGLRERSQVNALFLLIIDAEALRHGYQTGLGTLVVHAINYEC